MPVSERNSRIVYHALKQSGVKLISALPETCLVHLINMAEADPDTTLVRLTREEEGRRSPIHRLLQIAMLLLISAGGVSAQAPADRAEPDGAFLTLNGTRIWYRAEG